MSDKTYSGVKAYHEMLVRAQALSPALTFAMATLISRIKIKTGEVYQETEVVNANGCDHKLRHHFRDVYPTPANERCCTIMQSFLREIFHGYTVRATREHCGDSCCLIVETQFVRWLQSGVVEFHDGDMLVTIKI